MGPVIAALAVARAGGVEVHATQRDHVVPLLAGGDFAMKAAAHLVEFGLIQGGGVGGWFGRGKWIVHGEECWPRW